MRNLFLIVNKVVVISNVIGRVKKYVVCMKKARVKLCVVTFSAYQVKVFNSMNAHNQFIMLSFREQ